AARPDAIERPRMLADWFNDTVARTPDAIAVSSNATSNTEQATTLTYRQLDAAARQVADALQRVGVGPEVMVGLLADRTHGSLIAMLGIVKAGGVYVPL